ncbi:MAG: type II secretion system GspH family protein [Pseudomonadales bacterium]|nr:type II secretion system GspH family protein [Pseudomonadales bacterium]
MIADTKQRNSGFTLIELSVLIVVIGMLLLIAAQAIPLLSERQRLDTTDLTMDDVSQALVSFAAINARLPCPDVNNDGQEGTAGVCDPADDVGTIPYRELGFSDPVLDEAHLPIRYAVYRNSSETADLATLSNRFIPVLPGNPPTQRSYTSPGVLDLVTFPSTSGLITATGINPTRATSAALNDLDFCLALRNAKIATANAAYLHTLESTNTPNSAFVLVSGGVEDADGDAVDQAFDGVNEGSGGVDFESPDRRRNDSSTAALVYDDLVVAMPFNLLESKLSCAAVTISVTASANVAIAAAHALVQGEDAQWGGDLGRQSALVAQIFADFSVVTGAIGIWIASNDLAGAIGACSSVVVLSCGAVVAAGIGLGLAIAAEVAAVATVILTAIALVEADTALLAAVNTIPGLFDHAEKTRIDALAADVLGGQW